MKKGIVVLLLILALVVILSPRLVGQLAEQTVDENLNWAADTSGELTVASEGFDRGWFSSQGQHRVELGQGNLRSALQAALDSSDAEQMPALLINTHIDHGLIPVSSMGRDGGSLAPNLGSAVSTLVFEGSDGEQTALPGKILSTVGLSGSIESNYVVDEGMQETDDGSVSWQPSNIQFSADPKNGRNAFDGKIGALKIDDGGETLSIESIEFSGKQSPTEYGFSVGNIDFTIGEMSVQAAGQNTGLKGIDVAVDTAVDNGIVDSTTTLNLSSQAIPGFGEFSVDADMTFKDADAAALGALTTAMKAVPAGAEPQQMLAAADDEIQDLLAGGMTFAVDKLDVTLPMGVVNATMNFSIPKSDRADFNYSSLLTSLAADIDVKVPEALVDMAVQMNPQAGMVVGMGYLKKNGDSYELNAQLKSGLLTLNGAPLPLPF